MNKFITLFIIFIFIPFKVIAGENNEVIHEKKYIIINPREESCGKKILIDNYQIKNNILLGINFKIIFNEPLNIKNCNCKGTSQQLLIKILGEKIKSTTKFITPLQYYGDKYVEINKEFTNSDKFVVYYWCNVY